MDLIEVGDGADHVPGASPFFRSGRHGFSFSAAGAGEQVPPRIFRRKLAELAEQIAHALIHRFWHHHLYLDVLVAPAPRRTRQRHALFTQAELLPAVGARRNAQHRATVHGGYLDFGAERGFGDADGHDGIEVVAAALEERVRLDISDDVEVSGRAGEGPGISSARDAHSRAGLHASGDAHVQCLGPPDAPFAAADAADGAQPAGATAARTGHVEPHAPAGLRDVP